ncbi:MAG: hypothetical protein WC516_05205 [Patescibacteria group bacterium]|jgi:hypothetical protein
MEKENLRSRLQFLQKSIVEQSFTKDSLYKEGMRSSGNERISFFKAASKHANEIASMRKEINVIFKQLKKK